MKQLICPYCHSPDIVIDACATWNVEEQEWELSSTHDDMTCEKCGEEFKSAFEQEVPENVLHKRLIEKAIDRYGGDDIQIDDPAKVSEGDDGAWVQAWVWVAYDEGAT